MPPNDGMTRGSAATERAARKIGDQRDDGPIRLLQFTDLHLCADPDAVLLGYCTRTSFERVLDQARQRHWPADAILFTGDLVHDERPEAYRYLRQQFDRLDCLCFSIPGNHDRIDLLAAEIDADANQGFRVKQLGAWDILLLDSTIPGSEAGRLKPDTLIALERFLGGSEERPALVSLHHQPVAIGSRWIDSMQVDNGDALLALAERCPQIRVILWGHVHQAFDQQRGHTRLLATPSTCAQFRPNSREFALDQQLPGYRWLELEADGSIGTGVERLASARNEALD